jgi:hypothetical protein
MPPGVEERSLREAPVAAKKAVRREPERFSGKLECPWNVALRSFVTTGYQQK